MVQDFPVLLPSAWLRYMLSIGGELALGGHNLEDTSDWRQMLHDFWSKVQPTMPQLDLGDKDRSLCLPWALHGDEGRGKLKRPIMVLGAQPLISWLGPTTVNLPGYLCHTRSSNSSCCCCFGVFLCFLKVGVECQFFC